MAGEAEILIDLIESYNFAYLSDIVAGVIGPTGPSGPQGIQGIIGTAGTIGPKGDTGLNGAASTVAGPTGPTGPASTVAGPTGPTGPASTVAGPQGIQGTAGTAGSAGTQGIQGITGDSGVAVATTPLAYVGATKTVSIITGTTAGTVALGDDSRFTNARTPTAHNQTASTITDFSTAADARVIAGITGKADLANPTFSGVVSGVPMSYVYSVGGVLLIGIGKHRIYNPTASTLTIGLCRSSVGTAPTGAAIIIDVTKNGTTIFTSQAARPTIAVNEFTAVGTPAVVFWAPGEYITIDVDQVGSTIAGSDLTVQVMAA